MISQIACKLKNSFAIDRNEELYSWGSFENGLLGREETSDVPTPQKVQFRAYGEEFKLESISLGHFHSATICKLKNHGILPNPIDPSLQNEINNLKSWYENEFVWKITDIKSFIKSMLKFENNTIAVKYRKIKKLLLESFYAFLKINKKDTFNMNVFYETSIKTLLSVSDEKAMVPAEKFNLLQIEDDKIKTLSKEGKNLIKFMNFLKESFNHMKTYEKDFSFFIRFVTRFKNCITEDDLKQVFKYTERRDGVFDKETIKAKISKKVKNIIEHIKTGSTLLNKPELNKREGINISLLIDLLCNTNTGDGVVFTWGTSCDGRLGYETLNDSDENSNTKGNKYIMDAHLLQITPRIVFFNDNVAIMKVVCGYNHTLALGKNGRVYTWGNAKYGCLGNTKEECNKNPTIIDNDIEKNSFEKIKDIGGGMFFSVAIDEKYMYSWGCGNNGRLGHGDENSVSVPKKIKYFELNDITIKSFSCGDTHICAINKLDSIFSWGSGKYGKLGHGNLQDYLVPSRIEIIKNYKIDLVSCGSNDTITVTSDLKVFSWGKNTSGLLGTSQLPDKNIIIPTLMNLVLEDAKLGITEVAVASSHIILKLSNGEIFACGSTLSGISGIPNQKEKILEPKKIPNFVCYTESEDVLDYKNLLKDYNPGFLLKNIKSSAAVKYNYICCSQDNTAFLSSNGDLFMTGKPSLFVKNEFENNQNKDSNQTPNENSENTRFETPDITLQDNNDKIDIQNNTLKDSRADNRKIRKINFNQKVSFVAMARNHVLIVSDYKAYGWGKNLNGVLGLGDRKGDINKPTLIEKLPANINMVCCSDTHSMALTMNGEIYSFGLNTYGKLGIGSLARYLDYMTKEDDDNENNKNKNIDLPIEYEPQLVKNVSFAYYITCGNNHSGCIMKNNENKKNNIYTWGSGYSGKLGNGKNNDVNIPTPLGNINANDTNFIKISMGDEFTLGLDFDGILWGTGKKINLGNSKKGEIQMGSDSFLDFTILDEKKYKYITSSNHYSVALDESGKMYGFGKIFREKLEVDNDRSQQIKSLEKMSFVACGQNHFASISLFSNELFSWGSNSFFKCGQDFNKEENDKMSDNRNKYNAIPKKIDLENFGNIEKISNNEEENIQNNNDNNLNEENNENFETPNDENNSEEETQAETAKPKKKSTKISKRNIQLRLLSEKPENKNNGLIQEDSKIITKFYDNFSDLFNNLRNTEKDYSKLYLETENNILKFLNISNEFKRNDEYLSEIPKIINMNFQLYETFLNLLQQHPCYLADVIREITNKKSFDYMLKVIYGRNELHLSSRRINNLLLGLWNNIYSSEKSNLKTDINSDDISSYNIYKIILDNDNDNQMVIRDIISEVLIFYIEKICIMYEESQEIKANPKGGNDSDFSYVYKEMYKDSKAKLTKSGLDLICRRVTSYFGDFMIEHNSNNAVIEKNNINYSNNVIWIFKNLILKHFKENDILNYDSEYLEEEDYFFDYNNYVSTLYDEAEIKEELKSEFNHFLFSPYAEILKEILDSNKDNPSLEINRILQHIIQVLEKLKNKYSKIFNLYKLDSEVFKHNYLYDLISPNSEILKDVYEIFSNLSKSFKIGSELFNNSERENTIKILLKMNVNFCENLKKFKWDFTFNSLKDMIKSAIDFGNYKINIPLSVDDLINLQNNFTKILLDQLSEYKDNPQYTVLNTIGNFKIKDLENTSNIRNFILNLEVKPLTFLFDFEDDSKIIKCPKCLCPLNDKFFTDIKMEKLIYGSNWSCNCSDKYIRSVDDDEEKVFEVLEYDKDNLKCRNCGKFKKKESISNPNNLFKKYFVKNNDYIVNLYEEILYILPKMTDDDDLFKIMGKENDRLKAEGLKTDEYIKIMLLGMKEKKK